VSDEAAGQAAWTHWETTRRELREITDRITLAPEERRQLLTALDRSHAALAAWLVTVHRPQSNQSTDRSGS
jgi:hypothetical protein